MSNLWNWLTNAALNADAPPDGAPEGHDRTNVNNIIRQVMAEVRAVHDDYPWLWIPKKDAAGVLVVLTRIDDTQYRLAGADYTATHAVGRRVKVIGATTAYGRITASSFSGGNTDVSVSWDSGAVTPTTPTEARVNILGVNSGYALLELLETAEFESMTGVRDSSFEDAVLTGIATDDGGASTGWELNGTTPRAGLWSLRYDSAAQTGFAYARLNSSNPNSRVGQVPCHEGDRWALRAGIQHSGAAPGGAFVSLGVEYYSAAGVLLGSSFSPVITTTTGWVEYTEALDTAAPSQAVYCVPVLRVTSGSPSTLFWFDTIRLMRRLNAEEMPSYQNTLATLASASSVLLPEEPDVVEITGTTLIDTIMGGTPGRLVTLLFASTANVDESGNIKLVTSPFVPTADSVLQLVYDGTSWREVSRSVQ